MKRGKPTRLKPSQQYVSTYSNDAGNMSTILEAELPSEAKTIILEKEEVPFILPRIKEESADVDVTSEQTLSLDHDLCESPNVSTTPVSGSTSKESLSGAYNVILYYRDTDGDDEWIQVKPKAVDYDADEVTFQADSLSSDLDYDLKVYYIANIKGSALELNIRKPGGRDYDTVLEPSLLQIARRNHYKKPERLTFANDVIVSGEETFEIRVNSDIDFAGWDDADAYPDAAVNLKARIV